MATKRELPTDCRRRSAWIGFTRVPLDYAGLLAGQAMLQSRQSLARSRENKSIELESCIGASHRWMARWWFGQIKTRFVKSITAATAQPTHVMRFAKFSSVTWRRGAQPQI